MSRTEPKLNSFSPSLLMQITSLLNICNSPVQFSHSSHVWLFVTPWIAARQARLPCPSPTPRAYSSSCQTRVSDPSDHLILCHPFSPAINLSQQQDIFKWVNSLHQVARVLEFQLQHQSFQVIIQDWFHLGLTGWISVWSKRLSRVFSNTTAQKHQFFGTQLSL